MPGAKRSEVTLFWGGFDRDKSFSIFELIRIPTFKQFIKESLLFCLRNKPSKKAQMFFLYSSHINC